MSEQVSDNVNGLPFKLRFTSTQKLTKELTKMIADRYEVLEKLMDEYEHIGQHKQILANIKQDLETCHNSLKELRSLCQCQSDDDKTAANKQLATTEEVLNKLKEKCDKIQLIKCIDVSVKRLPSNWRAAMLKIAREKAKKEFKESVGAITDGDNKEEENKESNEEINVNKTNDDINSVKTEELKPDNNSEQMDEEMIGSEAAEISHQFNLDLERKIYETQVEEIMQMIQILVNKIKTMRARIDISKQLIKVVLKLKREYETSNSRFKESMATCHCAEAGADDDQDFQKRMEDKRRLEEVIERISGDLKYWEEQYSILKEGKNKNKENEPKQENINQQMTTTVVEVANEEVAHDYTQLASTSSQQSCMFAGQTQTAHTVHAIPQGTANPAVIYLEGLVANQQPTYIPASNLHQPIGVYPHTYTIGHPHPYAHQAPDGSIQVYSTDIASHPGYIAYQ